MQVVAVGLGGALGASLRYLISIIPYKGSFPFHTLVTNILGALIIGIMIGLIDSGTITSPKKTLFWKTGFCGGLTTFSTFSSESLYLLENERWFHAGVYMVVSLVFCIIGVAVGRKLVRMAM